MAQQLEFTIDWGYSFVYSRRQYHPQYCWDGKIQCLQGTIVSISKLTYPNAMWGPVQTAIETPLPSNEWKSTTRRGIEGIAVTAQCEPDAKFILVNVQGTFEFSAKQILQDGRIVFNIGWKYSHCTIIVTRKGFLWYRPAPLPGEIVIGPKDFLNTKVTHFGRMQVACIESGATVELDVTLPPEQPDNQALEERYWLIHMQAMTAEQIGPPEITASDYITFAFSSQGRQLSSQRYYFRNHDLNVQLLQDVWTEIPFARLQPGKHRLQITNHHNHLPLLINRLSLRVKAGKHLDVICPRRAFVAREFILGLTIIKPKSLISMEYDPAVFKVVSQPKKFPKLEPGFYELRVMPLKPVENAVIKIKDSITGTGSEAQVDAIYDLAFENPEVKVGFDMTTVPHDDTGEMDWILDYAQRTQLGNLVIFRAYTPKPVDPALLKKWAKFCRGHYTWVETANCFEDSSLPDNAGKYFHGLGDHEHHGAKTYFPDPDNKSSDMKHAARRFINSIHADILKKRKIAKIVSYGDASGGHRYSFIAGVDHLRSETMVAHTMHHLSQARPAAHALGKGEWGVHIAIQHAKQPYLASHLQQYYLSLMQPWAMGANFLYEEDSLFIMFKDQRQCWDDALTKGKRDMTRDFFNFAQTHPRAGSLDLSIGSILGKYAAPFNGFICNSEQSPEYSVWGKFGRTEPTWGHRQPEKAQQILDVLMPGASTHPLRQKFDKRRFFFSGTPFGDFDQVPVEADTDFLSRYKLLCHLGWNTINKPDYFGLIEYVKNGGTLLIGVPQFSTHTKRDFLENMEDLALLNNGDISKLCGAKILSRGPLCSGKWKPVDPDFQDTSEPELSAIPSVSENEDGPCHLADIALTTAKSVIIDPVTNKPLLIEHNLGNGRVYLITAWAYPGHEKLQNFSAAVLSKLASLHAGDYRVIDPSSEVFWTRWNTGHNCRTLIALNTDWATPGNEKSITVKTPAVNFNASVRQDNALIITCLPFAAIVPASNIPHIEILAASGDSAKLRIHGVGTHGFHLYSDRNTPKIIAGQKTVTLQKEQDRYFFELTNKTLTYQDCTISI